MMKHKMQVRIGEHEFFAEGPESLVKQQYEQFLQAIADSSAIPTPTLSESDFERSYAKPKGADHWLPTIKLPSKPPAELFSKKAILILYGALAIDGETEMSASELLAALGRENLDFASFRIDRVLSSHSGHVVKSGIKRGSSYALTAAGVKYAEHMIRVAIELDS